MWAKNGAFVRNLHIHLLRNLTNLHSETFERLSTPLPMFQRKDLVKRLKLINMGRNLISTKQLQNGLQESEHVNRLLVLCTCNTTLFKLFSI